MKKILKWVGIVLGGLILLIIGTVYTWSEVRLNRTYKLRSEHIVVPTDDGAIERGKHLVTAVAKCVDCHGDDLAGKVFLDAAGIGKLGGPNLTKGKGGLGDSLKDDDFVRAVRHAIGRNHKPLAGMPTENWHYDDEELGAIIAYVKSVPPVDKPSTENSFGPMLRFLLTIGQVEIAAEVLDHSAKRPPTPPAGVTVEYGKHMAVIGGCTGCHGPTLSGGAIPGAPPDWPHARNLTPEMNNGIGKWTEADFFRALREGKRPDGTGLRSPMPWQATAKMTDQEIKALWLFLRTLQPLQWGNR